MPDSSRPIQLLSDAVINKIAAGEVVERPASVCKELLENAIDAGATHVDLDVVDGGRKRISVADDGSGMTRDDALLAIERHATSKIRDVDDIENILTLGFRGEALAAISSVSRFTLLTRRAGDDTGTEITVHGGKLIDVRDAGCPDGTTMTVRNLFYNVPARRKFLRTVQTELQHIRQMFLMYALAHPGIGLRLVSDEREIYQLNEGATFDERLAELFGRSLPDQMSTVDVDGKQIRVRGRVSRPTLHRADRSEQYIFINGRPASAPVIGYALNQAYSGLLPRGRHPVVFLFLELEAGGVDVNVHPTKREVRFRRSTDVRDAVIEAIRASFAPASSHLVSGDTKSAPDVPDPKSPRPFVRIPDLPSLPAFDYPRKKTAPPTAEVSVGEGPSKQTAEAPAESVTPDDTPSTPDGGTEPAPWNWCRILGVIGGAYVVLETDEGMILMNPRAAHQRVLYESLLAERDGAGALSQGLLQPETLDLPPVKADLLRRMLKPLQTMGFGISDFGGDTFMIDALPVGFGKGGAAAVVRDMLTDIEERGSGKGGRVQREDLARAAAGGAVGAGENLKAEELERLVKDLAACRMPYTSPAGKPTLIFTGMRELDRKFGKV